jgi:hypothetical protein
MQEHIHRERWDPRSYLAIEQFGVVIQAKNEVIRRNAPVVISVNQPHEVHECALEGVVHLC